MWREKIIDIDDSQQLEFDSSTTKYLHRKNPREMKYEGKETTW